MGARGGERVVSAGDWALIILAAFWAVLVMFLAVVSVNLFKVLGSTQELLDGVRTETVPMLAEVRKSVTLTNREIDRVDVILISTGNITKNVERFTTLLDLLTTQPFIKAISFAYGAQKAFGRFRGQT
jgi:Bacterial protein of unknown function (DUF948)